ncbi:hypothetical protein BJ122_11315 [Rhodopseudomonas faecalis]|uniref:Uncharacterized protein n=1 Tax=Rhodopseudomonas faecalis TaxID=99655 RepID=A0A318TB71_9BRAD|nr:hypothetical protein BJ122_11315 [Rhodopseudomonas faecalis]
MVEHDDLQPIPRSRYLLAQKCEDFSHSDYIVITPSHRVRAGISSGPPRKIDLTGLIVDQETRHGMMRKVKEEDLEGERQSDVIGQPVGAAADFP